MKNRHGTLIHDTGRPPLPACIFALLCGGLALYFAWTGLSAGRWLTASPAFIIALFLFSVWFWRSRFYYDDTGREIIVTHDLIPGHRRVIPLDGAKSVCVSGELGSLAGVNTGVHIDILYQDENRPACWLTRVPKDDPKSVARSIAATVRLPLARSV